MSHDGNEASSPFKLDFTTNPLAKRRKSSATAATTPSPTASPVRTFPPVTPDSAFGTPPSGGRWPISPEALGVSPSPEFDLAFLSPPCGTPSPHGKGFHFGAMSFTDLAPEIQVPEATTVIPDLLYLGSEANVQNKPGAHSWLFNLPAFERVAVISVLSAHPNPQPFAGRHDYVNITLEDSQAAQITPHFLSVITHIERARVQRRKVIVHCQAGISRSASLVIAYLMFKNFLSQADFSFTANRQYLQGLRSVISPNLNFSGQLFWFEQKLTELATRFPSRQAFQAIIFALEQGYLAAHGLVLFKQPSDNLAELISLLSQP